MERDGKSKVEGIAAVGQTSQRNSHAKMLAPHAKMLAPLEKNNCEIVNG